MIKHKEIYGVFYFGEQNESEKGILDFLLA